MIILPFLAALMLASQPPVPPERLDPDDIEALEALLEALTRAENPSATPDDTAPAADPPAEADPDVEPAPVAADAGADETPPPADPATDTRAAPRPSPQGETRPEAAAGPETSSDTAPAFTAMGPHVGPSDYETLRGAPLGSATRFVWSVTVRPLDEQGAVMAQDADEADGPAAQERRFLAGNGWAAEETDSALTLNDFTARRQLRLNFEAGTAVNSSLFALARRNLDIYVFLSDSGRRETIEFGPDTAFDRFWLEAAMGVAAAPAELVSSTTPDGTGSTIISWQRNGLDRVIASARYGGCGTVDSTRARFLLAGLGYRLALHPDLIMALHERGEVPCAFSFVVISPDSPQGRIEHWTREEAASASLELGAFGGLALRLPEADLLNDAVMNAALDAARGQSGPAPAAPEFLAGIQALRAAGDYAGAFLLLTQETAHFGPCPAETIGSERIACTSLPGLLQSGAGNAAFARVVEASEAITEGAHRTAIDNLRGFIAREDDAGAAARTMLANEMLGMGEDGLAQYPDIDPVALLEEALVLDPFAPDAYWHLGRRYMEAGAPEAAWVLFDLARALPGREPTPLLRQAVRIEESLLQLTPRLFGPPAQTAPR